MRKALSGLLVAVLVLTVLTACKGTETQETRALKSVASDIKQTISILKTQAEAVPPFQDEERSALFSQSSDAFNEIKNGNIYTLMLVWFFENTDGAQLDVVYLHSDEQGELRLLLRRQDSVVTAETLWEQDGASCYLKITADYDFDTRTVRGFTAGLLNQDATITQYIQAERQRSGQISVRKYQQAPHPEWFVITSFSGTDSSYVVESEITDADYSQKLAEQRLYGQKTASVEEHIEDLKTGLVQGRADFSALDAQPKTFNLSKAAKYAAGFGTPGHLVKETGGFNGKTLSVIFYLNGQILENHRQEYVYEAAAAWEKNKDITGDLGKNMYVFLGVMPSSTLYTDSGQYEVLGCYLDEDFSQEVESGKTIYIPEDAYVVKVYIKAEKLSG